MSKQGPGGKLPPIAPKTVANGDDDILQRKIKRNTKKRNTREPSVGDETADNEVQNSLDRNINNHENSDREETDVNVSRKKKKSKAKPPPPQVSMTYEDGDTGAIPEPAPTKKKKKKPQSASREELMHNEEGLSARSNEEPKKKKKKKKKPQIHSEETEEDEYDNVGLAAELGDLKDDIIEAQKAEAAEITKWAQPTMRSEPVSKVFIEQRSGFKVADKQKLAKKRMDEEVRYKDMPVEIQTQTTIQFALSTHRVFKTFSVFLQGLFAGIALWQIVSVYTLSNNGFGVFLEYYYPAAMPVQSTYFFLFAICTVAVFDRYDIGRPSKRFWIRAVSMQSGAIACVFYIFGIILSTSIAAIDDKISLSSTKNDIWPDDQTRDAELSTWLILNLVRGLCPIIGWFIISLKPSTDRLTKNLEKADENILGEHQDYVNDVVRSSGV